MTDELLARQLQRFEELLIEQFPEEAAALPPGLDDPGIARLRAAIAPLQLPAQVEALYRWHDGSALRGIFCQWRYRGLEELLSWREFCLESLQEPPAWLQVFDDQCLGFVELDVPGCATSSGVWYCHTHDGGMLRLFESIADLVRFCADALASHFFIAEGEGVGLRGWTLDGLVPTRWKPADGPTPPAAWDPEWIATVSGVRSPDVSWPPAWFVSMGFDMESLRARGADHTIRELIERSGRETAVGIVAGTVTGLMGSMDWQVFTIDDGTGRLTVRVDGVRPFGAIMRAEVEVEVRVEAGASTPAPDPNETPIQAKVSARFAGVPAQGLMIRRSF